MNPANTFQIELAGSPLPAELEDLLSSAYVDDSLNLPDVFVLTFRDPDRSVLGPKWGIEIGALVTIKVVSDAAPGGQVLVKDAEITALEAEFDGAGTRTVLRGFDKSHRLFRGRTTEAYRNMSYSDVVRKVVARNGLSAGQIDSTSPVLDLVSQGNISDWQFVGGLAREVGYEVGATGGKIDFRKPARASEGPEPGVLGSTNPLQLVLGENLLRFRSSVSSSQQVRDVTVRAWDPKSKKEMVGHAPARTASADLPVAPAQLARKFGEPSWCSTNVPFGSQPQCEVAAQALAEQIAGSFATLEGVALGNLKLKAGALVSLGLAGTPFDGRYKLTSTRHLYEAEEGYTTWFTVSGRDNASLLHLAAREGGAPSVGRAVPGVVPAIVTAANDAENLCRVKVKFPWLSDTYESDWVRTVQLWAGNGYGAVVVPEVGDEVLVAFEQGDLRSPYLIGGLYNGQDRPKVGSTATLDASSGKINRRDLSSRTGHRLSFTEKEGSSDGILVSTGDDKYVLELSKANRKITINAAGDVEIDATGSPGAITLKASGDLSLQGRSIKLKADSGIQIDAGGGNLEMKGVQFKAEGTAQVTVQGATVSVAANATAELKGGAMVTVQGAMVKIN